MTVTHEVHIITERRLLVLCNHMERVVASQEPAHFDMGNWYDDESEPHTCGTVACAFGHAALIPEFNRLGLHAMHPCGSRVPTYYQRLQESGMARCYEASDGFEAAERFFKLSTYDARMLFTSNDTEGATALTWAKRTRHWLKTGDFLSYRTFE